MSDQILHHGVVEKLMPGRNMVGVRIADSDECAACAAAKICRAGNNSSELLAVTVPPGMRLNIGDKVEVTGSEQLHRKAIRLLMLYPTMAIIAVMVGVYLLWGNQLMAALAGVGVMFMFFIILYVCRNRINREFVFVIKRKLEAIDK